MQLARNNLISKFAGQKGLTIPWVFVWRVLMFLAIGASTVFWMSFNKKAESIARPIIEEQVSNAIPRMVTPTVTTMLSKNRAAIEENLTMKLELTKQELSRERIEHSVSREDFKEFREDQKRLLNAVSQIQTDVAHVKGRLDQMDKQKEK